MTAFSNTSYITSSTVTSITNLHRVLYSKDTAVSNIPSKLLLLSNAVPTLEAQRITCQLSSANHQQSVARPQEGQRNALTVRTCEQQSHQPLSYESAFLQHSSTTSASNIPHTTFSALYSTASFTSNSADATQKVVPSSAVPKSLGSQSADCSNNESHIGSSIESSNNTTSGPVVLSAPLGRLY